MSGPLVRTDYRCECGSHMDAEGHAERLVCPACGARSTFAAQASRNWKANGGASGREGRVRLT